MKGLIFEIQKGTKIENVVKTAGKVYRDEEDLYTILCKYDAVILSGFSFRDFSPKVETAIATNENGGKVFCITKFKENKPKRVFDFDINAVVINDAINMPNANVLSVDIDKDGKLLINKYCEINPFEYLNKKYDLYNNKDKEDK